MCSPSSIAARKEALGAQRRVGQRALHVAHDAFLVVDFQPGKDRLTPLDRAAAASACSTFSTSPFRSSSILRTQLIGKEVARLEPPRTLQRLRAMCPVFRSTSARLFAGLATHLAEHGGRGHHAGLDGCGGPDHLVHFSSS